METIRFESAENSRILVNSVGGDLRVTGRPGSFEAQAPERGRMVARQDGELIELDSRSGCMLFIPEGANLQVLSVGGDVRVTGVQGQVSITTVGGDLDLRRLGSVTVERVGGDVDVRRAVDLDLKWVGGDVQLERVTGLVRVTGAGGDLRIRSCEAALQISAGGDIRMDTGLPAGSESSVLAGGNLACKLDEGASARIRMLSGGDLVVQADEEVEQEDGEAELLLGEGDALVSLQAGGDLFLQVGGETKNADPFTRIEDVMGGFDMGNLNLDLEALIGLGDRLSVGQKGRVDRAVRKAAQARRHAERSRSHRGEKPHSVSLRFGMHGKESKQASEEEKLSILRMVEAGTITIEEADLLLKALEAA